MIAENSVSCFRCHKFIGVRFDHEATPPIYCLECTPAEKQERTEFVERAKRYRDAMRAST